MWTKIGFSIGQCIAAGNLCAKKRLKGEIGRNTKKPFLK